MSVNHCQCIYLPTYILSRFMSTKDSASIFWLFWTYRILREKSTIQGANCKLSSWGGDKVMFVEVVWHPRDTWRPLSAATQSLRSEPSPVYILFTFWWNFPQAHKWSKSSCFRSLEGTQIIHFWSRGCKAFTLQGEAHRHQGKPDRIYMGAYTKVQMSSLSKNRLKRRYTCWHHQRVMPNNYKYPRGSHNVRGE